VLRKGVIVPVLRAMEAGAPSPSPRIFDRRLGHDFRKAAAILVSDAPELLVAKPAKALHNRRCDNQRTTRIIASLGWRSLSGISRS
jgi:hypothetical protein